MVFMINTTAFIDNINVLYAQISKISQYISKTYDSVMWYLGIF